MFQIEKMKEVAKQKAKEEREKHEREVSKHVIARISDLHSHCLYMFQT